MRIWIGKEMEGRYRGISTMFIESNTINNEILSIILEQLENYPVNVLYFGAGRKNVTQLDYSCFPVLYNLQERFMLAIEFDKNGLDVPNQFNFDNNIFRTMSPELPFRNLSIKIDTEKDVFTQSIDCMFRTDLNSLQDCKFIGTDTEIYKD